MDMLAVLIFLGYFTRSSFLLRSLDFSSSLQFLLLGLFVCDLEGVLALGELLPGLTNDVTALL